MKSLRIYFCLVLGSCANEIPTSVSPSGIEEGDLDSVPSQAQIEKPTTELNIIDGSISYEPGVGLLSKYSPSVGMSAFCTAVEIGNRCLLTASHCLPASGRYIQETFPSSSSNFVPIIRVADFTTSAPDSSWLDTRIIASRDLAIIYAGEKKCPGRVTNSLGVVVNVGDLDCRYATFQTAGTASWNPKGIGQANKNDSVAAIGYSSRDITPLPSTSVAKRSGAFVVAEKYTWTGTSTSGTSDTMISYQLKKAPGSSASVSHGDSGGPLIKGGIVVGLGSNLGVGIPITNYAGFGTGAASWIASQKGQVCRKIGQMMVTLVRDGNTVFLAPGFKIVMKSVDSLGGYNKTETCSNQSTCTSSYIDLDVSITGSTGWTFQRWQPDSSCPCLGTTPTCRVKASSLTYKQELEFQWCKAEWKYVPPTLVPINSPTRTSTPIGTPTPGVSPTSTWTPAISPSGTSIPTYLTPTPLMTVVGSP